MPLAIPLPNVQRRQGAAARAPTRSGDLPLSVGGGVANGSRPTRVIRHTDRGCPGACRGSGRWRRRGTRRQLMRYGGYARQPDGPAPAQRRKHRARTATLLLARHAAVRENFEHGRPDALVHFFPFPPTPVWIRDDYVISLVQESGATEPGAIQFVVGSSNPEVTAWKQLRIVGDGERLVLGSSEFQDEVRTGAIIQLRIFDLAGRSMQLCKAKTFGVHTCMYDCRLMRHLLDYSCQAPGFHSTGSVTTDAEAGAAHREGRAYLRHG